MKKGKQNKFVLSKLTKAVNKKSSSSIHPNAISKHVAEIVSVNEKTDGKNLKSKLETNISDEFLEIAKMSQKKYQVLNEQLALQTLQTNSNNEITQNHFNNIFLNNVLKNSEINLYQTKPLSIPRRPKWKEGISKTEFERMEKEAFLNWRRALADLEEKNITYTITPFEKNIEVWRQLWLVVEKCQVLIQIVDGRNPLYFRCPDLEAYIKEVDVNKDYVLLINKADLMSPSIRKHWASFFKENNIKYYFFSALEERDYNTEKDDEEIKILSRDELVNIFKNLTKTKEKNTLNNCYYIGFIGYPNVGKSSVINVLMEKKKVGVAQMPGKTKHYQTLFLPDDTGKDICLMDCPGLVFPSFTYSKADMLVNGIMPIDTLREYHTSIAIIIQKIPKKVLENFYKIELPDIYSATQFLQILATKRGYYTGRNLPDEAKTAKLVLKDYVGGKLLYCNLRPDYSEEKHGIVIPYNCGDEIITAEEKEKQELLREIPADFDDNYEKINIDLEKYENNIKLPEGENFDENFFNMIEKASNENFTDKKITKDMKRALKFALKRGDITEEK